MKQLMNIFLMSGNPFKKVKMTWFVSKIVENHFGLFSSNWKTTENTETNFTWSCIYLQALEAEERHKKTVEELLAIDERKRPYNSMVQVKQPTEEEMEAWRTLRSRDDDPMAKFM